MKIINVTTNYFVFKVKEHLELKDKILKSIDLDNLPHYDDKKGTQSLYYDYGQQIKGKYVSIYYSYLTKYFDKFINYLNEHTENKFHFRNSLWIQSYRKNDMHAWHLHDDCCFFSTYFLELPKNSKPTIFKDGNNVIQEVQAEEGDLIIMPSVFVHCASKHESDERRTVIASNIYLKD